MNLFKDNNGIWLTKQDFEKSLREIGAHDCDVLFVHTALKFGVPNMELKNKQILSSLLDILRDLKVSTLIMPTFTFSFCNGKDYDPNTSKSRMGVLNEFFRKQEGVARSMDPLMSVALEGQNKGLISNLGNDSTGENSTYDKIHYTDGVKFLFMGPRIGDCFTYMHYLEWLYNVDYRYTRTFLGKVIDNGEEKNVAQELFVRYRNVLPNTKSFDYEDMMVEKGDAKRLNFGNGFLSIVGEKEGASNYKECLKKDPHFFVDLVDNIYEKTFLLESEMIAL